MTDCKVMHGDCLDVMRAMPDASVDAIVSDPPYGLAFMGKQWDHGVPGVPFWTEALRVAKPGTHLLAFGGTRTFHRLAVAIEDAGWEVRDCLSWLYGSGFPKSLDVSKAIDKAAGAERQVVGEDPQAARRNKSTPQFGGQSMNEYDPGYDGPLGRMAITAPATEAAKQWDGWGTALKPAWEPVIVARKPLVGTVAANVQAHGTGAMNVDGCRIGTDLVTTLRPVAVSDAKVLGRFNGGPSTTHIGRWPANVMLDEDAAAMLDAQTGTLTSGARAVGVRKGMGFHGADGDGGPAIEGSTGGASRFFYVAKASRSERNAGLEGFPEALPVAANGSPNAVGTTRGSLSQPRANIHPTVKPVAVMRWLCRLVTPPGGLVLDPFTGSGTTGVAALREGFRFVGIEREAEYVEIARARMAHALSIRQPSLFESARELIQEDDR